MLLKFSFSIVQYKIRNCQNHKDWKVDKNNPWIYHRVIAVVPHEELKSMKRDEAESQYLEIRKKWMSWKECFRSGWHASNEWKNRFHHWKCFFSRGKAPINDKYPKETTWTELLTSGKTIECPVGEYFTIHQILIGSAMWWYRKYAEIRSWRFAKMKMKISEKNVKL